MTPREARYQLAADIEAGTDIRTFPSPPDTPPRPPAVVLAPRPTYLQEGTTCMWEMRLSITLAIALVAGQAGLDYMDELMLLVVDAVRTSTVVCGIEGIDDIGPLQEAQGVQYVTGTMSVVAYIT